MKTPKLMTCLSTPKQNEATFATTVLCNEDVDSVVRHLARSSIGREAILNSPTVVRAMTHGKRQVKKECNLLREKQLRELAAKASHAKGRVTLISRKLRKIEARNKGLRTLMAKVCNLMADMSVLSEWVGEYVSAHHSPPPPHHCICPSTTTTSLVALCTTTHAQLKEESNADTIRAKERGRQVKNLGRQVRREQHLARKATRVAEDAADRIERQEAEIAVLKKTNKTVNIAWKNEKRKHKTEMLAEYSGDVKRLQKKRSQLQASVNTWDVRFDLASLGCTVKRETRVKTGCRCHFMQA